MPEAACVMRVHEVMRCGHVQEWPPRQRVHGGWVCPCAKPRLWVEKQTTKNTENNAWTDELDR